jgi:hypothetical protein
MNYSLYNVSQQLSFIGDGYESSERVQLENKNLYIVIILPNYQF